MNGDIGTVYVFSESVSSDLMPIISSLAIGKATKTWSHEYVSNVDVTVSKGSFIHCSIAIVTINVFFFAM